MRARPLIAVSLAAVALLVMIAVIALSKLPTGATLPVHWNAAGDADGFADARYALFLPVALSAFLSALFAILPRIAPLRFGSHGSAVLIDTTWTAVLALMVVVQMMIAASAFGLSPSAMLIPVATGALLMVIGNALPKSRPGFFVGIRTPWALADTDNWIATHRLGSRTMIVGGAMIIAAAVLPIGAQVRGIAVCLALVVIVIPPVVFSWWLWRRHSTEA